MNKDDDAPSSNQIPVKAVLIYCQSTNNNCWIAGPMQQPDALPVVTGRRRTRLLAVGRTAFATMAAVFPKPLRLLLRRRHYAVERAAAAFAGQPAVHQGS